MKDNLKKYASNAWLFLHQKSRKVFKNRKFWNWVIRLTAVGMAMIAFLFIWYAKDLPDPDQVLARSIPQSTKILDREGNILYEVHGEFKRTIIPYEEMNSHVKNATVAIEDKDFYKEGGINFKGLARSVYVNIIRGEKAQGGSTITQQFVKNALLTREKSYVRKIKEIILALEMDKRFSKDEILRMYLNEIPYGRNAYGIEAASQTYFGKKAKDLTLAESAYLAALPQSPSRYNPEGPNRPLLDKRKDLVLQRMQEQGYISKEEMEGAKKTQVTFQKAKSTIKAPHFVLYMLDELTEKYGEKTIEVGGLIVTTTLDPKKQQFAEEAVTEGVARNLKYNGHNAGLVAIDPKTGQILAMVGSKDYFAEPSPSGCTPGKNCKFEPQVNVAIAQRQPGSSAKPYVYLTSFKPEFKQSPASLRLDVETNFGGYPAYIPKNFDGRENGPVSIRDSLARSLNIPAVKTLSLVGVDNATKTMRDLGITSPLKGCGLTLVLGGCEVRLIDHTGGYAGIANMGNMNEVTGVLKIEDNKGNVLEEYEEDPDQAVDAQAAYELIDIMTDNNARLPTFGSSAAFLTLPDRKVMAKTGTTQNYRDGWTMGATPSLAAGVWVGNNNGAYMTRDAVLVAGPIWNSFMRKATAGTPVEDFKRPSGIQEVVVDRISGKLPTQYTPSTKKEVFASYAVPTEKDDVHVLRTGTVTETVPVGGNEPKEEENTENENGNGNGNGNNNTQTPPTTETRTRTVTAIFRVLRSERPDDPNWEEPVRRWAAANGYNTAIGTAGGDGDQTEGSGGSPNPGTTEPQPGTTTPPTTQDQSTQSLLETVLTNPADKNDRKKQR
jgi:penicillin-binding protein 1C